MINDYKVTEVYTKKNVDGILLFDDQITAEKFLFKIINGELECFETEPEKYKEKILKLTNRYNELQDILSEVD